MRRLAALGALLLALTLAGLSLHQPGAITLPSLRVAEVFVALAAAAAAIYGLAVRETLRRETPRGAVWLVLGVALALRLSVLFAPPFLSSDVFRYVWDGMVQEAGVNPYRYLPDDPALERLRDAAVWPHVNRASTAPTIYPPTAQLVFQLVARASPTVLAMKAAMVGFELAGMTAVVWLLDRARLPRARLLIYAWNPLAVWAFAGNGHVDALAIGLIGLALLARASRCDGAAGFLLGAAALVKFLPAAVAPALWRRGDWRMPAAALVTIVALYLPYIGVGWRVLGFLPGYAAEEGIDKGSAFWLLAGLGRVVALSPATIAAYEASAALALGGLALWVAVRPRPRLDAGDDMVRVCRDAAILAAATMAALSPHYSWYFAWLALPCCLAPLRSVIYLSAAGLLLDLNPWDERFFWAALLYGPAVALAVLDWRRLRPGRAAALGVALGRSP